MPGPIELAILVVPLLIVAYVVVRIVTAGRKS